MERDARVSGERCQAVAIVGGRQPNEAVRSSGCLALADSPCSGKTRPLAYNSTVARFLAFLALLAALAIAAAWYVQRASNLPTPMAARQPKADDDWLTDLYSQNPRDTELAIARVNALGLQALPVIRRTLQDPNANRDRHKGALKACAVLGPLAAEAVPDVAAMLPEPELTAEAAVALSFMGADALPPLRAAVNADDATVRREACDRSGSSGRGRRSTPVTCYRVLLEAMSDEDEGVRAVAATYLGILHEDPKSSVPLLIGALEDTDVAVRRASAGPWVVRPSRATGDSRAQESDGDPDEDLVREAGRRS